MINPPDGVNINLETMYAIVEIAGQQFKVEPDKKLFVHQLDAAEGDSVDFDKVLLVDNDGNVSVGTPTVDGAKVSAKVLEHVKGDKVLVFKKKRRKGYRKLNGHRQQFTQIQIENIVG
ncbi:MAG: 50S ribosomal protein L21 [Prolixibacteraceae bacterium]|nr:50S ribosomal protein L21 [Prolixibacteraceae bacterium]